MNNGSFLPVVVDPKSQDVIEMARKVAHSNATILISGETGVGKELLAKYIHSHSNFAKGPFISVNCAALPDNMVEAILFGYEKGAFTGAVNSYAGKFEQAHNGTLLLDEISEIPLALQGKLLRVLQEREVERLCGKKLINVNVRIIAATNRDLNQLVLSGLFRKDLYYRLSVVPIHYPALRNRTADILPLVNYFIKQHANLLQRSIPALTIRAENKLTDYSWPGNVREMENIIQRALIMTSGDVLEAEDFVLHEEHTQFEESSDENVTPFDSRLKENEAKVILDVLKEADGSRDVAARKLKISPRTLRYKISKLKLIGMKVP